jgi:hypothetical protein
MAGLDIAAMRARNAKMQGQDNKTSAYWKPTEGDQVIRIVPWKDRPEDPFIELLFHYIGGKTQLSPLSNGNPDPIAEFGDKIRNEGGSDAWQQAKDFMPKKRTYVPVVVRGEEDQGVRFYSFGATVYKALISFMADEDYGDITDPKTGRDIKLNYVPKDKSDTNFPVTNVIMKPLPTALSDNSDQAANWMTNQPDIMSLVKEPSYEDLRSFLRGHLDPDVVEPDTDESVTQQETSPAVAATVSATIDDFDALFDKK